MTMDTFAPLMFAGLIFTLLIGFSAAFSLMALGLGCAPVYPSLMHEAAQRFDAATTQKVIGRQVGSAYIGCMVVPALMGLMGAAWGVAIIMPTIAACVVALLACTVWLDRIT